MKLKNFFWQSEVLTSICWVIFFMIMFFVNPYKAEASIFILFFLSLLFAFAGTWGILEFRIVTKIKGLDGVNRKIFNSFRHGFMVSLAVSGLLFMQGIEVLTLWDGVVFVLAIILFEAYFLTRSTVINESDD